MIRVLMSAIKIAKPRATNFFPLRPEGRKTQITRLSNAGYKIEFHDSSFPLPTRLSTKEA